MDRRYSTFLRLPLATPVRQSAHACAFWVEEKRLVLMRNKRLLLIIIKGGGGGGGREKSVLLAKGSDIIKLKIFTTQTSLLVMGCIFFLAASFA